MLDYVFLFLQKRSQRRHCENKNKLGRKKFHFVQSCPSPNRRNAARGLGPGNRCSQGLIERSRIRRTRLSKHRNGGQAGSGPRSPEGRRCNVSRACPAALTSGRFGCPTQDFEGHEMRITRFQRQGRVLGIGIAATRRIHPPGHKVSSWDNSEVLLARRRSYGCEIRAALSSRR